MATNFLIKQVRVPVASQPRAEDPANRISILVSPPKILFVANNMGGTNEDAT